MKPSAIVIFDKADNPLAVLDFTASRGWRMTMIQSSLTKKLFGGQERTLVVQPRAKRSLPPIDHAYDILEVAGFRVGALV